MLIATPTESEKIENSGVAAAVTGKGPSSDPPPLEAADGELRRKFKIVLNLIFSRARRYRG